jgi:membrane associated rhomboid family serine protease
VARRSPQFSQFFTFGGRVPATVGLFLALMLAASVWGWTDRGVLGLAALAPAAILQGQLWRLVTWPFFQDDPFTLLFGGFMLWSLGQQLSYAWSERRFATRFLGYAAGAALLTTLLALVWPAALQTAHVGVWPVVNALLVAWAMLFPDRQVNIWGVLPLTGKTLALLVAGGTVLYAIAGGFPRGFAAFAPHLFALGLAWVQARGLGGRRSLFQARQWWAEREGKRRAAARAKHLKVVRKDGPDDRSRWMN